MEKKEEIEIMQKAIAKYGKDAQIEMLIEEASEVIQAIHKRKRFFNSNTSGNDYMKQLKVVNENLFEELADLSIMVDQAMLIFPTKQIQEIRERKLLRLKERLL